MFTAFSTDTFRHLMAAVALLQSWIDQPNAEEEKQTGDFLVRALDEDRIADRKVFPPGLEGVTW